jgi:sugar O-acyltransferase (sialic acid O-acetyltransferase NeuD family)
MSSINNKPKLLLIGAGGHAESCIDVLESESSFEIGGILGSQDELGKARFGYNIIGTDEALEELANYFKFALVSVGQIKTAELRIKLYHRAMGCGFQMPTIISPSAYVSRHAKIGPGTIVMHKAVVNAGAKIGENCIINSQALVEHGAEVGDHCHVSTGAILNGEVKIGSKTFIGSGSLVKERVRIGMGCVVGMGLCVHQDIVDYGRLICQ